VEYKVQTSFWIDSVSYPDRRWEENRANKKKTEEKWSNITNYEHGIRVVSAIRVLSVDLD
jgi:hypothetical protein